MDPVLLTLKNQGSEMVEILLDNNTTEDYNIEWWEVDDEDNSIKVFFNDIMNKYEFQTDFDIE
jgi:hypothetical protein